MGRPAVHNKATVVGGFVLGGLVLGVIAILLLGGARVLTPKLRVVAYFQNSVAGLAVGAPVTLRGVRIGTVGGMKVYLKLPDVVPVIPVYMDIQPDQVAWTKTPLTTEVSDIELAIKAGLRAQLATQSLVTGQVSVNLDFFPDTSADLVGDTSVPEIPTIPSDLQHIKNEIADLRLPDLAEKAREALTGLNGLVGELNGKVGPLADSVRETSDSAHNTLETASSAVRQLQLDASRTLESVDRLSRTTEGQVATTGKNIDQVVAKLDQVATRAEKVMDNLNDLTSPRSMTRDNLEAAVRDLSASASSLRNFSKEVERNPSSILLGRGSR
jgi:paraquat-inducible protein B